CAHRVSGRHAIIDQQNAPAGYVEGSAVAAIRVFASLKLLAFTFGGVFHLLRSYVQRTHDLLIDDANASRGDRPHGEFRLRWRAQLTDDEDVERSVERLRDLVSDRNAAARQREHDRLFAGAFLFDELAERCSEPLPGVDAIGKQAGSPVDPERLRHGGDGGLSLDPTAQLEAKGGRPLHVPDLLIRLFATRHIDGAHTFVNRALHRQRNQQGTGPQLGVRG